MAKDNPVMAAERTSVSKLIFEGSHSAEKLHNKLLWYFFTYICIHNNIWDFFRTILNCGETILDEKDTMRSLEATKLDLSEVESNLATHLETEKTLEQQREV